MMTMMIMTMTIMTII